MARKPRNEHEAGVWHVWARGNNRQLIFHSDFDRRRYLRLLAQTVKDFRWRLLAYCLMGNHVHLVVETTEPNLGEGMKWLQGTYALQFNQRYRRTGHLFEDRFGSQPQASDNQLKHTIRYVVLNPVKAGLCQFARDWPWSSHRAILLGIVPPWLDRERLLSYFEPLGGTPLQRYAAFVDANRSDVLRFAA